MLCVCRNCGKVYESLKARGDLRGFCSAKCQHVKAKACGFRANSGRTEYDVLKRADAVGDAPVAVEVVTTLFGGLRPKKHSKGWTWTIRVDTLRKHHAKLLEIKQVNLEYHRREDADMAIVTIGIQG